MDAPVLLLQAINHVEKVLPVFHLVSERFEAVDDRLTGDTQTNQDGLLAPVRMSVADFLTSSNPRSNFTLFSEST